MTRSEYKLRKAVMEGVEKALLTPEQQVEKMILKEDDATEQALLAAIQQLTQQVGRLEKKINKGENAGFTDDDEREERQRGNLGSDDEKNKTQADLENYDPKTVNSFLTQVVDLSNYLCQIAADPRYKTLTASTQTTSSSNKARKVNYAFKVGMVVVPTEKTIDKSTTFHDDELKHPLRSAWRQAELSDTSLTAKQRADLVKKYQDKDREAEIKAQERAEKWKQRRENNGFLRGMHNIWQQFKDSNTTPDIEAKQQWYRNQAAAYSTNNELAAKYGLKFINQEAGVLVLNDNIGSVKKAVNWKAFNGSKTILKLVIPDDCKIAQMANRIHPMSTKYDDTWYLGSFQEIDNNGEAEWVARLKKAVEDEVKRITIYYK